MDAEVWPGVAQCTPFIHTNWTDSISSALILVQYSVLHISLSLSPDSTLLKLHELSGVCPIREKNKVQDQD